jgi:hypothetical protein
MCLWRGKPAKRERSTGDKKYTERMGGRECTFKGRLPTGPRNTGASCEHRVGVGQSSSGWAQKDYTASLEIEERPDVPHSTVYYSYPNHVKPCVLQPEESRREREERDRWSKVLDGCEFQRTVMNIGSGFMSAILRRRAVCIPTNPV